MKIIAHRANDKDNLKENSKKAIINALNKNYIDGVEFDIRITKDNNFVLNHNSIYNNKLIKNTKLKDIKELDILSDVLNDIKSNKIILIDIKIEDKDYISLANLLIKELKKYKLNIYLCSFNYDLCLYLKNKTKHKIGLLISGVINKNKNYDIFDFISIKYTEYKEVNKTIFVWTINEEKVLKNLLLKMFT